MADPLVTELKLEWAMRQLEERDFLVRNLRSNVDALLDQLADAAARNETLKRVQDALTREKIAAERHVETLMHEKAELASENARLHIYAKEARAQADRASRAAREQQLFSEARAQADELLLAAAPPAAAGADAPSGFPPPLESAVAATDASAPPDPGASSSLAVPADAELREARAQLLALKLVLARVLHGLGASGLQLDRAALLAPERAEARGALERVLRRAILAPGDADAPPPPLGGEAADDAQGGEALPAAAAAAVVVGGPASVPAASAPPAASSAAAEPASADPGGAPPPSLSSQPSTGSAPSAPAAARWGAGLGVLLSAATLGFWSVLVGDQSDEPPPQAQQLQPVPPGDRALPDAGASGPDSSASSDAQVGAAGEAPLPPRPPEGGGSVAAT